MLETPEERVRLLKARVPMKTIEFLYLSSNNIKIISVPLLFEKCEVMEENKPSSKNFPDLRLVTA